LRTHLPEGALHDRCTAARADFSCNSNARTLDRKRGRDDFSIGVVAML
jgi:hypothetical protein